MSLKHSHPYRKIVLLILFLSTWPLLWLNSPIKALWPSLLALLSVLLLRKVISGLLIGGTVGVILLNNGNPLKAFESFFSDHLVPSLTSSWNISVLIFTLLLGGFVALLEKGGGIQALVQTWLSSSANIKKRVQWSAFTLGLICFFDGLANSLLVGKSLTPVAKQAGVSREKLSYIVDSTSASVACVAVISTWIAYQLSMIKEGFELAGQPQVNTFAIFFQSIPLNFYCWFTLILLAVVIARNWNIGPMKQAETNAKACSPTQTVGASLSGDPISQNVGTRLPELSEVEVSGDSPSHPWRAILPLTVLILGLLIYLYTDGVDGTILPLSFEKIANAFGAAAAAKVLVTISAFACIVAYITNKSTIKTADASEVFLSGVMHLFKPCLILISVWVLTNTVKQLDAATYISLLLNGNLPPELFPAAVFIVGTLISFTTGTSWGTMGILMPLAIPVALNLGSETTDLHLVYAAVAAVFSGAVFGDHCSPLSDTTIVSSIACDIDPLDHVRTQFPYALIAAALAIIIGFIPTGLGWSPWISLITGTVTITLLPTISKSK